MVEEELILDEDDDENLVELKDIDYSRKSEFSKAGVVQEAVKKVEEKRAREMMPGYWNMTIAKDGSVKKSYVDDTRRVYHGSLAYLRGTLEPEIKSSEAGIKALKNFEDKEKELFNKYSVKVSIVSGNEIIELEESYIPEVDEITPELIIKKNSKGKITGKEIIQRKGLYNWKNKMYWNKMVENCDKFFQELNSLIAEKEFFKTRSSF